MNKVFIPDNDGGGTWETWKDNRPNYKAHAQALAEALKLMLEVRSPFYAGAISTSEADLQAETALAAWEGDVRGD